MIERYRDLGGDLAFLSANNFFYRVERRGTEAPRPSARVARRRPPPRRRCSVSPTSPTTGAGIAAGYMVRDTAAARWIFAGVGGAGTRIASFGIEIDAVGAPPASRWLRRCATSTGPARRRR